MRRLLLNFTPTYAFCHQFKNSSFQASVDVQFYDSAVPMRRHEEVIVFTSIKPFEQYALYKERVCPFCMASFDVSKHYILKRHGHCECYSSDQEPYNYKKNGRRTRYTAKDYEDYDIKYKSSRQKKPAKYYLNDDHEKKGYESFYASPKPIRESEYDQKHAGLHRKRKDLTKMHEESMKEIKQQSTDYAQKHFMTPEQRKGNSDEKLHKKRDYSAEKAKHRVDSHELKEMCIHAVVHRPSDSACMCKNCIELGIEKDHRKELELKKHKYERKIKSEK